MKNGSLTLAIRYFLQVIYRYTINRKGEFQALPFDNEERLAHSPIENLKCLNQVSQIALYFGDD